VQGDAARCEDDALSASLRRAENIGRLLTNDAFMTHIETPNGRNARAGKRGQSRKES
jgi:hypothetical protein